MLWLGLAPARCVSECPGYAPPPRAPYYKAEVAARPVSEAPWGRLKKVTGRLPNEFLSLCVFSVDKDVGWLEVCEQRFPDLGPSAGGQK